MKHIYALLVLCFCVVLKIQAQEPITITEDSLSFGNSTMPGFIVTIPEVAYDDVVKNWTKELESGTRSKVVGKNNELTIFGARKREVSDNPVNIYSILNEGNGTLNMQVAMELERDMYIDPAEAGNAKEYLFDFAKEQYMEYVSEQLNDEKSKLRSLESDLNSLQREQSKMEKSSRKSSEIIAEEQERLSNLNNELEYLSAEPGQDDPEITGMGTRDPDAEKDLEKEIRKLNRQISSAERKIERAEDEIDKNQRDIPRNAEEQQAARNAVTEQEVIVRSLEDKLETIKGYRL